MSLWKWGKFCSCQTCQLLWIRCTKRFSLSSSNYDGIHSSVSYPCQVPFYFHTIEPIPFTLNFRTFCLLLGPFSFLCILCHFLSSTSRFLLMWQNEIAALGSLGNDLKGNSMILFSFFSSVLLQFSPFSHKTQHRTHLKYLLCSIYLCSDVT